MAARLSAREPAGCSLTIGSNCNVEGLLVFEKSSAQISIGSRAHIGGGTVLAAAIGIEIGDDVLIAFDALIMDHDSHSLLFRERRKDVRDWMDGKKDWANVEMGRVHISDKAWVGARSIILKGTTIGEGAIVAAGSVVTRDVSPWTIVGGNPAKLIRALSEDERIVE
jgi:galactoside O-acetyltransferase